MSLGLLQIFLWPQTPRSRQLTEKQQSCHGWSPRLAPYYFSLLEKCPHPHPPVTLAGTLKMWPKDTVSLSPASYLEILGVKVELQVENVLLP